MQKLIRLILLILVICSFNITSVFASTNTFQRSESNYMIPDDITVTEANKDNILNTPAVDASEKVYDFADLFTDLEEENLYSLISTYINNYQMDLAVVTINDNNKYSAQEYADDFYDYNYFGINYSSDGILFLIDMDNREIYMSTTGSAIDMYNDYRIDQALDAVYTYMSNENYYEGVSNYIDIISNYASEGLPSYSSSSSYSDLEEASFSSALTSASIFSLVVTVIIIVILIFRNKMVKKATTAREYLKKESVVINNIGEVFLGSNTVRHKIERESSSGGGGGGSSRHSGSSGRSHGGGGRKF